MDSTNTTVVQTEKQKIEEKLQQFVVDFVFLGETQLAVCSKRIIDGISEPGKWADLVKLVNDAEGESSQIWTCVELMLNFISKIGGNHNFLSHLHLYRKNPAKVKKELVEAGIEIFRCYESQFMKCTCKNSSWKEAMRKFANSAVGKWLNYLETIVEEEFSVDSITKGVTHISLGQTQNADKFNSEEVFTQTGIVKSEGNVNAYHKSISGSKTGKYGFRQLFKWEQMDNSKYEITEPATDEYKYVLSSFDIEKFQKKLFDEVTSEAHNLRLDEYPSKFLEQLQRRADKIYLELESFVNTHFKELTSFIMKNQSEISEMTEVQKYDKVDILIWFDVPKTNKAFVERQNLLTEIAEKLKSGIVVISGMSGMGKSELAKKYAHDFSKDFNGHVIWINAESQETIKESFHRLAMGCLEVRIKNENGEEKSIDFLVKEIYENIDHEKSLFIFDAADTLASVEPFLPKFAPELKKPEVLITSQNSTDWESERLRISSVKLYEFTDDEARQFAKLILNIKDDSQNQDIEAFIKKLHNSPLALMQASLHIKEKQKYSRYTIAEFLKEFEKSSKKLQNDKYLATIYNTLRATLSKIKNEKTIEVISVISYFESNEIPRKLLEELTNDNITDVLSDLDKYAIGKINKDAVSVYGLIQKMRRIILKEGNKEYATLSRTLEFLKIQIQQNDNKSYLLPHVISVWNYAYMYDKLIDAFIVKDIVEKSAHKNYFQILATRCNHKILEAIVKKIDESIPKKT